MEDAQVISRMPRKDPDSAGGGVGWGVVTGSVSRQLPGRVWVGSG